MHNRITILKNKNGERIENHEDITEELLNHFKDILRESNTQEQEAIEKITQHIPKLVNEDHNRTLLKATTMMQVEQAVFELK